MNWHEEARRGCAGKATLDAGSARRIARRSRREPGGGVRPYRCPWCKHWHVGHPLSMERVKEIADAIRERGQDPAA